MGATTAEPDVDVTVLDALDFDHEPPCEGSLHPSGDGGHIVTQTASWLVFMPCCGGSVAFCNGRARRLQGVKSITCKRCRTCSPADLYRWVPLTSRMDA